MLCQSLLYNNRNQLFGHIPPLPFEPSSHAPPSHPSRSPRSARLRSSAVHQLSTNYFTHGSGHRSTLVSPFAHSLRCCAYFTSFFVFFFLRIFLLSKSSFFSYILFFNWTTAITILVLLFKASNIMLYFMQSFSIDIPTYLPTHLFPFLLTSSL